ncbi:unnamed protein product [Bursaphelenchus xylophilus]|uniref:(pine wood nematode) hypothetical protein n=1 Tax=Bursaphelenchus xylophilus TaxID=6326 RepID=A0A1I7SS48_BURXY|nr:unnamed protein product [Bursaphelenchus xylophilus]CAG9105678.1 unnamed protein product [Bursaphelenchus xylophilus]
MESRKDRSVTSRRRRFDSRATAEDVLKGLDLSGKTILITGTTNGIGTETARALAHHGAHVVMLNRNRDAAERLRDELYSQTRNRKIDLITCDLASLQSVKEAAEKFIRKGWPLHALILNAGVMSPAAQVTKDDFNTTFGVNHLAHFYLTLLLKDRLISSAPSRVVVVSSNLHRHTGIDPKSSLDTKLRQLIPRPDTSASGMSLYSGSKLCNILFAFKLHREIHQSGVNVNAVHPGVIFNTGLMGTGRTKVPSNLIPSNFTTTVQQGAATSVYCAVHPDLKHVSGHYFEACWDDKSYLSRELAEDKQLQDALWSASVRMIRRAGFNI